MFLADEIERTASSFNCSLSSSSDKSSPSSSPTSSDGEQPALEPSLPNQLLTSSDHIQRSNSTFYTMRVVASLAGDSSKVPFTNFCPISKPKCSVECLTEVRREQETVNGLKSFSTQAQISSTNHDKQFNQETIQPNKSNANIRHDEPKIKAEETPNLDVSDSSALALCTAVDLSKKDCTLETIDNLSKISPISTPKTPKKFFSKQSEYQNNSFASDKSINLIEAANPVSREIPIQSYSIEKLSELSQHKSTPLPAGNFFKNFERLGTQLLFQLLLFFERFQSLSVTF